MKESQLRELIREELKSKTSSKSKLNESTNIADINKAIEIVENIFRSDDVAVIIEILSAGISNVIGGSDSQEELAKYADQVDELENSFEQLIFEIQASIAETDEELTIRDEELIDRRY